MRTDQIYQKLQPFGIQVGTVGQSSLRIDLRCAPGPNAAPIDLVITLGGDGTILHASSLFKTGAVPPVLSFSMGTLGFLLPFRTYHHPIPRMLVSILTMFLLQTSTTTRKPSTARSRAGSRSCTGCVCRARSKTQAASASTRKRKVTFPREASMRARANHARLCQTGRS